MKRSSIRYQGNNQRNHFFYSSLSNQFHNEFKSEIFFIKILIVLFRVRNNGTWILNWVEQSDRIFRLEIASNGSGRFQHENLRMGERVSQKTLNAGIWRFQLLWWISLNLNRFAIWMSRGWGKIEQSSKTKHNFEKNCFTSPRENVLIVGWILGLSIFSQDTWFHSRACGLRPKRA